MKKFLSVFAVSAALVLSLGALVGCSSSSSSASGSSSAATGMPNPMKQVSTMPELAQETGVYLTTDPVWSSQKFFVYEIVGAKMAEVQFIVSDYQGSLRAMKSDSEKTDISGVFGEVDYADIIQDNLDSVEGGRIFAKVMKDLRTVVATWYNTDNGVTYSVSLVAPIDRTIETLLKDLTSVLEGVVD